MDDSTEQNGEVSNNTPFDPWYHVRVTGATKNGESVNFDIETKKLEESGKETTVQRVYEDFEWLQHCLATDSDVGGVIMPPLPARPIASPADAAARSKKELGTDEKIKGDEFHKDCRTLEKYLQQVVRHCILGKNISLAKFLTETQPPVRAKLKKSLLTNFSKAVGEVRKGGHQDVDEYFQKERATVNDLVKLMKEASDNFNNMLNHEERLASSLNHLSTSLCLASTAAEDGPSSDINKMQLHLAKAVEHYSHGIDVFVTNDEKTLGFCLDHYARYLESEKAMLYGRTCKLVEFENATKALEKAKPLKREANLVPGVLTNMAMVRFPASAAYAEELKEKREREFNEISEVAKKEISKFQRQRVVEFQKALILYAEAKIKTARDISALIAKDISTLKQMEFSSSASE